MAHRGRLNTLTNIFRKPVRDVFSEFEGKDFEDEDIDGDVKYHLGLTTSKTLRNNKELKMNLVPNPSHLETVGPVVQGISRAKIDHVYGGDNSKFDWGKDIFKESPDHFAHYIFNRGFGTLNETSLSVYDYVSKKPILESGEKSDHLEQVGKAITQTAYQDFIERN